MSQPQSSQVTKRGLTDPERAAIIAAAVPDHALDTQRKYHYFIQPRWKRLSEYEQLSCYAQPNPDWIAGGLDWGDWTQKFHGGRPSWGNESTELRTTDWYRHRDPARRWHAPYVKDKSEEARYTQRFLAAYSSEGSIRTIDAYWRDEILNKYYGALLYNEYGLFNAHSSVGRDCLSDTIRQSATFAGLDKVDNAQMIQMERLFIAKLVPGFDASTDVPKKIWTTDPIYAGARSAVEEIWQGIQDWNEILWAGHAVYDATFGQFARREFFQRLATVYGDTLTPFFTAQSQTYFQTTRGAIEDLFVYCLANDPEFGAHNRTFLNAWTEHYLARSVNALKDFVGIYAKVEKVAGATDRAGVSEALQRVFGDWKVDYADKIGFKIDVDQKVDAVLSGYKN
ncbi:aromatic/alkene monooxygenase hydroxylase subunit beta [Methylocystis sp. JR02]|uniref:aromatic/alkene monooxygenase hydroxylase subunit beta n=1 Tax=Methylocystis sp. JR02 TaxID=3046284 RepID=UPI0024B8B78A|nr:aromatic/alkene monooxygenase hydroxylase subunit beta [Methylocystis sp. JR02]MDJ0448375.1 aromatic/alkene monooxygenase hydroxylase subunit beta [Methylocystis sp. JR02]